MVEKRMSSPGNDNLQEHRRLGNAIAMIVMAMAVIKVVIRVGIKAAIKAVPLLRGPNKDGTTMAADMEEQVGLLEPAEAPHHGSNKLLQEAMDTATTPAAIPIKVLMERLPPDYHGSSNSHTRLHLLVMLLHRLLLQVQRLHLHLKMDMDITIFHRHLHHLHNDVALRTSSRKDIA